MTTLFDNINEKLLPILQKSLAVAYRADFCIGYFNLGGWAHLADYVDKLEGGEGKCCRVLIGMAQAQANIPSWRVRYGLRDEETPDPSERKKLLNVVMTEFYEQLIRSIPSNRLEKQLKQLVEQLKTEKLKIRLFLKHSLHAKLYLLFREDDFKPLISYLGSSNLTHSGLSGQGELNVDVEGSEVGEKLIAWFNERWETRYCEDISQRLIELIEQSWVEQAVTPYEVYLKIAYHLSQEARISLNEFEIPRDFRKKLFPYQVTAVKLAARHLAQRGGVLLADVVGLGKTMMATVLAKIFEEVHRLETLIICPKNLVSMWKTGYCDRFLKMSHVLSLSEVINALPDLKRYHLVIIDESHNLRNKEGKRYKAIREYLAKNDSKVILLSATPYNKTYEDLANQLGLFVPVDKNLGIRPEVLLKKATKDEKRRLKEHGEYSLAAFTLSPYPDDWRELMRLYMVRRTRSFIQENYTLFDTERQLSYLLLENQERAYFPIRKPKTLTFSVGSHTAYGHLYAQETVDLLSQLYLPRYGLGDVKYLVPTVDMTTEEEKIIRDLNRGGKRLMGFCRTNLFKRLESSESAFLYSVERHVLRNFVMLHALENQLPVPLGTEPLAVTNFDAQVADNDVDFLHKSAGDIENDGDTVVENELVDTWSLSALKQRAVALYGDYQQVKGRFRWLAAKHFSGLLSEHLNADAMQLLSILQRCGQVNYQQDAKLATLVHLITELHPTEKILVFTQFADTALYLAQFFKNKGVLGVEAVTGQSDNPSEFARRFSPVSHGKTDKIENEIRVLIATDVLSEGQNLQDASIVVNYDLPWAIVRLIQRVGRVDRIGQQNSEILCYSFLPAEGVESLINLRQRLRLRLQENAEVIGTDEAFFEDETQSTLLVNLYHEKAGSLDDEVDHEVDLISEAYAIWTKAIKDNPDLKYKIPRLPPHIHTAKAHTEAGAVVYLNTPMGGDALAFIDASGKIVTDSPKAILTIASCRPDTPALARPEAHFELVKTTVQTLMGDDDDNAGSGAGNLRGIKFKVYNQLKALVSEQLLLFYPELPEILELLNSYPLYPEIKEELHYKYRHQVSDEELIEYLILRFHEKRLCIVHESVSLQEPQVICSLGLVGR
ncbi:helicase family protein [Beggiatoa alba B18LD]|uniref:Helicase family protein n=1 Tax=Beggiatoa alba B18LD TaxID=395493 RepID=I3CID2_9GAMM|nr:helicase-related protein [Beggiatoa alba]EIJ43375.1 helicase family protein [Beggiatoa alba B18LD]